MGLPMTPYVVGLGGSLRGGSTTDNVLRLALKVAAAAGARTLHLGGLELNLPMYSPDIAERTPAARRLLDELRKADGIIIGSPSYHGSISGYVKNALDYVEDLHNEPAPYFDGRAVGCISIASGWHGAVSTLEALRSVVHALRGWPTPLGVPIVAPSPLFDASGNCVVAKVQEQIEIMARQVVDFASRAGTHRTLPAAARSVRIGTATQGASHPPGVNRQDGSTTSTVHGPTEEPVLVR
jgi:FMN reductase